MKHTDANIPNGFKRRFEILGIMERVANVVIDQAMLLLDVVCAGLGGSAERAENASQICKYST